MPRREMTICIWLHHLATIMGMMMGIIQLCLNKKNAGKKCLLTLFTVSQGWAVIKIAAEKFHEQTGLQKSSEALDRLCSSKTQKKRVFLALTGVSVLFKIGTPYILSLQGKG